MKRFVALGIALAVLLFHFIPAVTTADTNVGVSVCEDLEPNPDPYDSCVSI